MSPSQAAAHRHRWLILAVIGIAQLMVVLDATIVNIALPTAQRDLAFSDESRQWVITAYALAFGSLLLVGGRLGDLYGRKRVFVTGLVGFAVASAIGGAAGSFGVLVAARALQGLFGALLAPAALSLLSTTFTDPAERAKAFGVFGAIAGAGAAVGLLLGGILTEYLSWRWCLYVNLLFALPAATAASALLHDAPRAADSPRIDLPGALVASSGLFALVYGFSSAESRGWGSAVTIGFLAAGAALLAAFVAIERRVAHPLLPMRVVLDRDRGGSYLAVGITGAGMFGVFLFLTFFLQGTLAFSPIQTGLAFLPMTASIMASAAISTMRLLPRFGPRPLITGGMVLGSAAMVFLTGVSVDSTYAADVLPGLLAMGVGMGLVMAPAMNTATLGVPASDAGIASAMVNTGQQVGGSIGTAFLSTLAASATTGSDRRHTGHAGRAGERRGRGVHDRLRVGGRDLCRRSDRVGAASEARRARDDARDRASGRAGLRPLSGAQSSNVTRVSGPWWVTASAVISSTVRRSSSTYGAACGPILSRLTLEGQGQLAVVDAGREALALLEPRPQRVAVRAVVQQDRTRVVNLVRQRHAQRRRGLRGEGVHVGSLAVVPGPPSLLGVGRGLTVDPVAVGQDDPGDHGAETRLDLGECGRPAAVLDDVVKQSTDRLVLVAVHLQHQGRDRQQMRHVRDRGALAELARVVGRGVVQCRVEPFGQQRTVGEGLGHRLSVSRHGRLRYLRDADEQLAGVRAREELVDRFDRAVEARRPRSRSSAARRRQRARRGP